MKSPSPTFWFVLILLLFFVSAAIIGVLRDSSSRYFSSPTEVRVEESGRVWDPTFHPPPGVLPAKPFQFPKVTSSLKEDELRIEAEISKTSPPAVPDIRVIDAGNTGEASFGPDLTIRLLGLAAFWPDAALATSESQYHPATFIDPFTLEPALDIFTKKQQGTPSFYLQSDLFWPEVMFAVETTNYENFRWLGFRILNAENHTALSSGSSYHHAPLSQMATRFEAWHNPPFILALDFAYGPPEIQSIKAVPGSKATFSGAEIEILELHTGNWNQGSRGMSSEKVTHQMKLSERDPDRGHLGVLSYAPREFGSRLQCYLPDGSSPFVHANDGLAHWTSKQPLPSSEIEFRFLPNHGRVIFHLPPLPGGPNHGQPIENLFDVRIPYLVLDRSYERLEIIRKASDMTPKLHGISHSSTFPKTVHENISIGELLDAHLQATGNPHVTIDQTNHEIIETTPLWERIKTWLNL